MKKKRTVRQNRLVTDTKRAAREIIGEPSRNRKRGPHKTKEFDVLDEEWEDLYRKKEEEE